MPWIFKLTDHNEIIFIQILAFLIFILLKYISGEIIFIHIYTVNV
jgi:hypothetical protein